MGSVLFALNIKASALQVTAGVHYCAAAFLFYLSVHVSDYAGDVS